MEKSDLNIILNAMLSETFIDNWYELSEGEKAHIAKRVDYSRIPERYMMDEDRMNYIEWSRVDKMQAVRLCSRDKDIIGLIDFKKFNYTIREVYYLVKDNSSLLVDLLIIDFDNMKHLDAVMALCFGNHEVKKRIDMTKYVFSFSEIMSIIRAFKYDRNIILELDYKKLKGYQIAEIFANTGEENMDILDVNEINTLEWLSLLEKRPEFLVHCDLKKFIDGDPFNSICLAIMFHGKNDLYYLLDGVNPEDISPYGWEKLLIKNPDKFVDKCLFSKLNKSNWARLETIRPELLTYKPTNSSEI